MTNSIVKATRGIPTPSEITNDVGAWFPWYVSLRMWLRVRLFRKMIVNKLRYLRVTEEELNSRWYKIYQAFIYQKINSDLEQRYIESVLNQIFNLKGWKIVVRYQLEYRSSYNPTYSSVTLFFTSCDNTTDTPNNYTEL